MVGHVAMLKWLHNTGIWQRTVKEVPLGFEVEVHSEEIFFKLMALNGQFLPGSSTPLKVTSLPAHSRAFYHRGDGGFDEGVDEGQVVFS